MSKLSDNVAKIVESLGSKENIKSATHCVTRLRLILKDQNKVDIKALDENDLVQGNFLAGGQFQVVIGPNVQKVYDEFIKQTNAKEVSTNEIKEEANSDKNWFQKLVRLLGDIFIPIIPAIVASGLLMGLNNVMGNPGIFYSDASFIEMHPIWQGFYDVVNLIANTSFTFLPALVGYSAVKKFGGNPVLGIVLGLVLVHPNLTSAYTYAADPSAAPTWNIFGLEIAQVAYQGQVLPVLVASYILVRCQKAFERVLPDALQLVLVSPLSLLITGFVTFIVIGPITMAGANYITQGVVQLFDVAPLLGGAVYGLISAPLVITGMHHLFLGVNLQMAGTLGYVTLWPVGEPVTIAQGAACIAMWYLLRRHKKMSNVAVTSATAAFLGITEPAIYGVNLRYKFPFIAVMITGTLGGAYMGLMGIKATSVGVGGALSFLSIFPEQWGAYIFGQIAVFVLTIALTIAFSKKMMKKEGKKEFISPMSGKLISLENVEDKVFSTGMMGDGFAVVLKEGIIKAPFSGEVSMVFPTKHAIGLKRQDGLEVLLHIGMDTVELNGEGFEVLVKQGDHIEVGQALIQVDLEVLKQHNKSIISPIIFTSGEKVSVNEQEVNAGQTNLKEIF